MDLEPGWVAPMLATAGAASELAGGAEEWLLERKLDGLRTIAVRDGPRVELWSRNHLSFAGRFPALVSALRDVAADRFVIDGEIVAFEGERSGFGLLSNAAPATVIKLVAFDLVHLLGRDVTALGVEERRRLLGMTLEGAGANLAFSKDLTGEAVALLKHACSSGWEGLVAKKRSSTYQPGRSRAWRKLKCVVSQELVIGGWTEPAGSRTGLGALLVGVHDETAVLRYAGRVGTGFSEVTLAALRARLGALETPESPFAEPIRLRAVHWARPELVAAVGFSEWTSDAKLRHPRFEGLRPDVDPTTVRRDPPPAVLGLS